MKKIISLLTICSLFSFQGIAGYLSIHESGEILPENGYQFGLAPQLLLNEGGGVNADVFVDTPYNDSSTFRFQAGAGKVDFHASAAFKYVPFPDFDQQPAIGVKTAFWYARVKSENVLTAQIAPLISKRFPHTDYGMFIPYVAIPININSGKEKSWTGSQFVFGSEWRNPDYPNMLTGAEVAMSLNESYSALSVFFAFPFDGKRGFRR